MKRISACGLFGLLIALFVSAQTPPSPTSPQQPPEGDEVIRISSELVQTDVVVTDKNDRVIDDLKINDFELYENGKRQEIKFLEFVSEGSKPRMEGNRAALPASVAEATAPSGVSAKELRRVFAFVIDDLTMPYQELPYVRQMLSNFVDNQMREGDLVAIVRVVGGKGLLQQFTSDKQLLRRAIASIRPVHNPNSEYENVPFDNSSTLAGMGGAVSSSGDAMSAPDIDPATFTGFDVNSTLDVTQRALRGIIQLETVDYVINSLREIPGHKSLVLVSGGLSVLDIDNTGTVSSTISYLVQLIANNAARAGVTINTLDARGLNAVRTVARFQDTPGRSSMGSYNPKFGRGGGDVEIVGSNTPFAISNGQLGLQTLASATGGVSVQNTNDFQAGLNRVVARSAGYYLLAYTPSEQFDGKFHKLQIKVKRSDAKVYSHAGYVAREASPTNTPRTKEEMMAAAARSPLAKRDLDLFANLSYQLTSFNKAAVVINMLIDAKKLNFKQSADERYKTSYDVVGFVYDETGKLRGGFSDTVLVNLTRAEYERALDEGLPYTARTDLPSGYFQFRAVVRETDTGLLGTYSRYIEIPDLSKKHLATSSIFLASVDPKAEKRGQPEPLLASRRISRTRDLRYMIAVYNPTLNKNGQVEAKSQLIISQGGKILFKEPEQPFENAKNALQVNRVGQLGLGRVKPGRYVLTLVITDPLADKKENTISRSIDFTVTD